MRDELTEGEKELLVGGLNDDIALVWALIHLGIRENPPERGYWKPSAADLDSAFESFGRLLDGDLIRVGRIEYIDGGSPGRVAPVRHVPEDLARVRRRVEDACRAATEEDDWAYACWVVTTPEGDALARSALDARG